MTPEKMLREAERHLKKFKEAEERISAANSSIELRDAWEDALAAYTKTVGRIIAICSKHPDLKGWGNKLRNEYAKNDEGMVYLREARNFSDHALGIFSPITPSRLNFRNGLAVVGEGVNIQGIHFSNCVHGNEKISTSFDVVSGSPSNVIGASLNDFKVSAAEVNLQPIKNEENGKVAPVPTHFRGRVVSSSRPNELIKVAVAEVESMFEHIKDALS